MRKPALTRDCPWKSAKLAALVIAGIPRVVVPGEASSMMSPSSPLRMAAGVDSALERSMSALSMR